MGLDLCDQFRRQTVDLARQLQHGCLDRGAPRFDLPGPAFEPLEQFGGRVGVNLVFERQALAGIDQERVTGASRLVGEGDLG